MDLLSKKCVPCEEGTEPFARDEAEKYLSEVKGWEIVDEDDPASSSQNRLRGASKLKIRKRFRFESYMAGIEFVNKIAKVADGEDHHPDLYVGYKKVTVNLMTHNIGGLSENDFIMAAKIDQLV